MKNQYFKGHGLGNDYIALDPTNLNFKLTPRVIRRICDRNWGVGSDGILALYPSKKADFGLRIYNPDGSEAEKSGNGLRIFGCYLFSTRKTKKRSFSVQTKGGMVHIDLDLNGKGYVDGATVDMGQASFQPRDLPCSLRVPELIQQPVKAADQSLRFTGVSVGNPHCVVFKKRGEIWTREDLLRLGPELENHTTFPKRNQCSARRSHGSSYDLHSYLGARSRGNTSFGIFRLCRGKRRGTIRTGEKSRDH